MTSAFVLLGADMPVMPEGIGDTLPDVLQALETRRLVLTESSRSLPVPPCKGL
jgi:hypothetical protein